MTNENIVSKEICAYCKKEIEIEAKKNTLGFLKIKCNHCGEVVLKKLSKYYVAAYVLGLTISIFVIVFSPAPVEKLGVIFLMLGLCIYALIKNMSIKTPLK